MALVSLSDVSLAARSTLTTRLPAHLAGLARPLPVPTSYDVVPTSDAIRRVQGAACAVSANALRQEPERKGDGSYDAWFVLTVALFHQNTTATPLLTATGDYAAAIRQCLEQHRTLGGLAETTRWTGESADLVGDALTPSNLGLAVVEFSVKVLNVLDQTPPAVTYVSVASTFPSVTVR